MLKETISKGDDGYLDHLSTVGALDESEKGLAFKNFGAAGTYLTRRIDFASSLVGVAEFMRDRLVQGVVFEIYVERRGQVGYVLLWHLTKALRLGTKMTILNLKQLPFRLLCGFRPTKKPPAPTAAMIPAPPVNPVANQGALPTLGDLANLPRELRDEIYVYLVVRRYAVAWPKVWSSRGIKAFVEAKDLSILRVSHGVSYEAQEVMYAKGQFVFYLEYYRVLDDNPFEEPCEAGDTSRMMNIHFDVDIRRIPDVPMDTDFTRKRIEETCKASILRFCGASIERNKFSLTFRDYTPNTSKGSPTQILSTPLGEAFKGLYGFDMVRVRVVSCRRKGYIGQHMTNLLGLSKSASSLDAWDEQVCRECHLLLHTFRTEVGPYLGLCKTGEDSTENDRFYSRYLEFHPRYQHARSSASMLDDF
ncbi:MAG: hypothetical protein Q9163_003703 [Psora crenata]